MKQRALFVGVNQYRDPGIVNLQYAISDAVAMKDLFESIGFETELLADATRGTVDESFRRMTADLSSGDVFLFYFAGHGFAQADGSRQLLVCGDDIRDQVVNDWGGGIRLDALIHESQLKGCHRIFFLDTSRTANGESGRGLVANGVRVELGNGDRALVPNMGHAEEGSLAVMLSCSPGQCVCEVQSKGHGLFTLALIETVKAVCGANDELVIDGAFYNAVVKRVWEMACAEGMPVRQCPELLLRGIPPACHIRRGDCNDMEGEKAMEGSR